MKQENSQPAKQHKKMNGFADRKLLAGLVFAVGDYMALTLSACLALHLRNIVMTYNVYHINLSYIFFWVPLVFMPFILYSGLYTKRMLTYKRNCSMPLCMERCFPLSLCSSPRWREKYHGFS